MECRFFLDVVVTQGSSIFQLFSSKYKTLLIWRNSLFVLDFGFDIFDCVRSFNFKGDGFSSQCFDKDLHTTSQSKDKMKCRFLLDVVVTKGSSIFQLLSSKDETLLIWRDTFFVLDLGLDIFDCVGSFDFKGDGFSCQCFDKDLHTTSQSQDQMECRFFLDVVVTQGSSIFQLLSSKDKTLLIWRNSLFVLDFGFDIFDCVRSFNFKGDGFSCQCFDKDLHTTSQSQDQMECRFFLDVVVTQGSSIFQLLSSKDETLLIWR